MIAVVQRVKRASVEVDGKTVGKIDHGLMILLGVAVGDGEAQAAYLADRVAGLRIFTDEADKMNLSLLDVTGGALVVSNFTLCADCRKGRRPSFIQAARPEQAQPLYELFCSQLRSLGVPQVQTGLFGAEMMVNIANDGPVTTILDTDQIMLRG